MKTNLIDFTGDPMLVRALDGAVTVSIPIRIRRIRGRMQIMVPQGASASFIAQCIRLNSNSSIPSSRAIRSSDEFGIGRMAGSTAYSI